MSPGEVKLKVEKMGFHNDSLTFTVLENTFEYNTEIKLQKIQYPTLKLLAKDSQTKNVINDVKLSFLTVNLEDTLHGEGTLTYEFLENFDSISVSIIAKAVSISYLGQLLEAGVKVYMYKRGMIHSKYMVIDGTFCSIGSANLDIRSFEYNFEVNAIIYNQEISTELENVFENDKKDCFEITLEQWENRPISKKLTQAFMRIVAPLI